MATIKGSEALLIVSEQLELENEIDKGDQLKK